MNRSLPLWIGAAGSVLVTAGLAARTEQVLANGATVFFPVRPRDPRSLVQGDYHRLVYDVGEVEAGAPASGELALALDARGVVQQARLLHGEPPPDTVRIDYRLVDGDYDVAPDAFLIEEGTGDAYLQTRYAELRVTREGRAVLVGLRDADLVLLGPAPRIW